MKKKTIKGLHLNKKTITSFNGVKGGRPEISFYRTECEIFSEAADCNEPSRFINSDCLGCTITTVSG